jgi:hypothetical protein
LRTTFKKKRRISELEECPDATQDATHPTQDSSDATQNTTTPPEGPPRSRSRLEKKKGKQSGRDRILSTIERVSLSLENDMGRKRGDEDLTRQMNDLKHEFDDEFDEFQGSLKQEIRKDIKEELKSFMGELGMILKQRDAPSDA